MTEGQEAHLEMIKNHFTNLVDVKYRAGQAEHGGNLYSMSIEKLIDNALDEAIDQVVYLLTLKDNVAYDAKSSRS